MASNRLGFKPFRNKLKKGEDVSIVVDSNILIANYDELHSCHDLVRKFLCEIEAIANITYFTTVTTKAEFLDYQRKRFLTEGLFDLVDEYNREIPLSTISKASINSAKGRRNKRQGDEEQRSGKDPEHEFDTLIDEFCEYLSPHREDQKHLFIDKNIDWQKATEISPQSGMGFSDSLILNMLLHTKIEYIFSLDFDVIYAAAVSAQNKWVVLPDSRIPGFKNILKNLN